MLDHTKSGQNPLPTARALAQMRLIAQAHALPEAFADVLAASNSSPEMAEKVAPGLAALVQMTSTKGVSTGDLAKLAEELIGKTQADDQTNPDHLARQIVMTFLASKDAQVGPARPFTATMGSSWESPAALSAKIADARAAAIAPFMGLKHEPTMGRDVGMTPLDHARAWTMAAGLHLNNDQATMEAFVTGRVSGGMAYMSGTHTRSDFPTIAGSTVQILVGRALDQAPVGLALCASRITAKDWRARTLANTSAASSLTVVSESGNINFRTIDETGETIPAPSRYAGAFRATEELLRNASSGGYELELAIARALLAAAQESQRSVLAAAITGNANMADGQPVFSAAHANLATTGAAISVTTLGAARTALQRFVDSRGAPRPVTPAIILVAPEQQTVAEQVVTDIMATTIADANPFSGLRVVVDPALPGGAGHFWYVLPEPTQTDGLAFITMEGQDTPQIETRDAWPNFGMEWRVSWPLAATFVRASWFRYLGA